MTNDLARWQFATTSIYHFLFVPVTIGLRCARRARRRRRSGCADRRRRRGLQAAGHLAPGVVAEVGGLCAAGDDQTVVVQALAAVEHELAALDVEAGGVRHQYGGVGAPAQRGADRGGALAGGEAAAGDLVEQRLEEVVLARDRPASPRHRRGAARVRPSNRRSRRRRSPPAGGASAAYHRCSQPCWLGPASAALTECHLRGVSFGDRPRELVRRSGGGRGASYPAPERGRQTGESSFHHPQSESSSWWRSYSRPPSVTVVTVVGLACRNGRRSGLSRSAEQCVGCGACGYCVHRGGWSHITRSG